MDSGPFSTSQPADRRAVARPEQAQRPKEPQQVAVDPPRVAHRSVSPQRSSAPKRSGKRYILPVVIILVVALAALGGWFYLSNRNIDKGINKSEYQAVFFTNGQVYIGKLAPYNNTYLKLTSAFIVVAPDAAKTDINSEDKAADPTSTQLVKITSGTLAPHDEMFVARSQVLFYENLQPNGKAAKLIQQYKE